MGLLSGGQALVGNWALGVSRQGQRRARPIAARSVIASPDPATTRTEPMKPNNGARRRAKSRPCRLKARNATRETAARPQVNAVAAGTDSIPPEREGPNSTMAMVPQSITAGVTATYQRSRTGGRY